MFFLGWGDFETPGEHIPVGDGIFICTDFGESAVDIVLPVVPVCSSNRVVDGVDECRVELSVVGCVNGETVLLGTALEDRIGGVPWFCDQVVRDGPAVGGDDDSDACLI